MLERLIKESINDLKPYVPHDYDYKYKLDANESPYNLPGNILEKVIERMRDMDFNRYPDTNSVLLRKEISDYIGVDYANIIIGNGSDEMINVLIDTFVEEGDTVLSHEPTFVMYGLTSKIAGATYIDIETDENFNVDIDELIKSANTKKAKIIFLCSPNNPTGNLMQKEDILRVVNETNSIVVADEAYVEFGGESVIKKVLNYDRLIVLRTLSKAFGVAGIRTGYLVAGNKIIDRLYSVKAPYNINSISQLIATELMKNRKEILNNVEIIKSNRDKLLNQMKQIEGIKAYDSYANFILFRVDDNKKVFDGLLERGIMVRNFSGGRLENHLRVSVGNTEENEAFVNALREVI